MEQSFQPQPLTIGVDTGGTFTDVVVLGLSTGIVRTKAPTTPGDFAAGVMNALGEAARATGMELEGLLASTKMIKHGSTVATNALITRGGVKVGFLTTRGFEDTAEIMRAIGRVDGLPEEVVRHVTWVTKPTPLVPRRLVRGVSERIDYTGDVLLPLNIEEVKSAIAELLDRESVDAVAVSFLHSWANPEHERAVRGMAEERLGEPGIYWSFGSELSQLAGEYARANTAITNAYVGPIVAQYLNDLDRRLRDNGFEGSLLVMQGNGGLAGRERVAPIANLQSGPAGGMIASAYVAQVLGHNKVLTTDMGGTSFDVSLVVNGHWSYAEEPVFERFRILQPIVNVQSIGAGGGTIARVDAVTQRLTVGPQSAGARPGPVCYGEGGQEVTVSDADLVLGMLNPDYFLGGRKKLDVPLAEGAIEEQIAEPLNMSVHEAAAGIYEIINNKMSDLIRRQIFQSGYLPEEFVLYAFGGAGPVHAAGFARELGIDRVYVFPTASVFSAFGCAMADVVHTRVTTMHLQVPSDPALLNERLQQLEAELWDEMRTEGIGADQVACRRVVSMRYRRQTAGVEVVLPWDSLTDDRMEELAQLFERRYEGLYGAGSGFTQAGIELNTLRVDAIGKVPKPPLPRFSGSRRRGIDLARKSSRPVYFHDRFLNTDVYEYERFAPGDQLSGPAIIESPFTTIVVPSGAQATLDDYLNVILEL